MSCAAFPTELIDNIALPDHRRLRVRPLRCGEDAAVLQLYRRLSPRTRYLRFFSEMPVLPDVVMRLLTGVDYQRSLALLAEVDTAEGVEVVALGSFAAVDDRRVEVGLVVSDAWQRQGIGLALAARVMRAARARGFDRFVAHTLWDNRAIRRILRHVADIVSTTTRHGISEITFVHRRVPPALSR